MVLAVSDQCALLVVVNFVASRNCAGVNCLHVALSLSVWLFGRVNLTMFFGRLLWQGLWQTFGNVRLHFWLGGGLWPTVENVLVHFWLES